MLDIFEISPIDEDDLKEIEEEIDCIAEYLDMLKRRIHGHE